MQLQLPLQAGLLASNFVRNRLQGTTKTRLQRRWQQLFGKLLTFGFGQERLSKAMQSSMQMLYCASGIAKKQAERQQKAREEAIASGMLTLKGSGKSKRRSDVDKGLAEDGGSFKGGMLRVKGAMGKLAAQKKKKGSTSHKRAFSSAKIGNLDGNSQKAWNVAKTQNKKMTGSAKKGRR